MAPPVDPGRKGRGGKTGLGREDPRRGGGPRELGRWSRGAARDTLRGRWRVGSWVLVAVSRRVVVARRGLSSAHARLGCEACRHSRVPKTAKKRGFLGRFALSK